MAPRFTYGIKGPDGSSCLSIGLTDTVLPCPGVALRLSTVIDCTPANDRMPPVTIHFLNKHPPPPPPPPQQSEAAADAHQQQQVTTTGRFTCNCGDFVLFSQLQRVEAMVAAAGLPRECATSVEEFFSLSASHATNSFYKAMAITVEAGSPAGIIVDDEDDEDEDEELPPGVVVGECAICYREYVAGGATSVKLPCSHAFHRKCMDRWTAVNRTCPCCRAPVVPEGEEQDYWVDEEESEYEHDVPGDDGEEDGSSSPVPDGSI